LATSVPEHVCALISRCKSASNLDPRRYRRKSLSGCVFSPNRRGSRLEADQILLKSAIPSLIQQFRAHAGWGPSWTPIHSSRRLEPTADIAAIANGDLVRGWRCAAAGTMVQRWPASGTTTRRCVRRPGSRAGVRAIADRSPHVATPRQIASGPILCVTWLHSFRRCAVSGQAGFRSYCSQASGQN
jgi:hypothetical protein